MTFDVFCTHAICGTEVPPNVDQRGDLETDSGHERASPANEVDDEYGEEDNRNEFDNPVEASCQKFGLGTRDTKVAKDSWRVLSDGVSTAPLPKRMRCQHEPETASVLNNTKGFLEETPLACISNEFTLML